MENYQNFYNQVNKISTIIKDELLIENLKSFKRWLFIVSGEAIGCPFKTEQKAEDLSKNVWIAIKKYYKRTVSNATDGCKIIYNNIGINEHLINTFTNERHPINKLFNNIIEKGKMISYPLEIYCSSNEFKKKIQSAIKNILDIEKEEDYNKIFKIKKDSNSLSEILMDFKNKENKDEISKQFFSEEKYNILFKKIQKTQRFFEKAYDNMSNALVNAKNKVVTSGTKQVANLRKLSEILLDEINDEIKPINKEDSNIDSKNKELKNKDDEILENSL